MNGEGWPISATYRDGQARNGRDNITNITADLGATANYNPSRFNWLNLKTTRRHAVRQLPPGPKHRDRHDAAAGRRHLTRRRDPVVNEATTLQKTLGHLRRGSRGAARSPVHHGRACAPTRTARSARTSSASFIRRRACRGSCPTRDFFPRSSVFSAISNFRLRVRVWRVRRAAGTERRASHVLGEFREHQEHRSAVRNIQRDRQRRPQARALDRVGRRIRFAPVRQPHPVRHDVLQPDHARRADQRDHRAVGRIRRDRPAPEPGLDQEHRLGVHPRRPDHRQPPAGLDFHFATSLNANKVMSLGNTPPQIGTTNWIVAGYPIRGSVARADHRMARQEPRRHPDGGRSRRAVATRCSTTPSIRSPGKPKHSVGVGTYPRLRGAALSDDVHAGPRVCSTTACAFRACSTGAAATSGTTTPSASAARVRTATACSIRTRRSRNRRWSSRPTSIAAKTLDGFFQPGGFVKWREASATLAAAAAVLFDARASRSAALVFTARNLKLWTKYRGTDPESDFTVGEGGDAPSEFQTFAQPTYLHLPLEPRLLTRTATHETSNHERPNGQSSPHARSRGSVHRM